ncbi:Transcriptional activator spt7, partial [Coemansia thaxteri]
MRAFANSTHDAREAVSVQDVQAIEHGADVSDLRTIFVPVAGTSEAGEARRRNEELDWERKEWLRAAEELDSHGWPFVSECEPVAGLPQLETLEEQAGRSGVLQWLNDDCEATVDAVLQGSAAYDGSSGSGDAMHAQPSIDAYATARFPDNEMWRAMADNVDCLRNIRAIDSKIWASRLNIPVGMLQPEAPEEKSRGTRGQHSADEQGHILTRDMHSSYAMRPDPPAPFSLDAPSARKLLDRTSAFMLAHTGFDAATSSAISTLSGFFADFITNLGRTLRTYSDKHSRTMSAEAMLAHSLYSNGVEDLSELEYYMRGEVRKHGNKLLELQKKIVKSYQDSMSDGRLDSAAPPDASALESGDAFMIG